MKMYGLFKCSYDYYEWKDLEVVSLEKVKLEEYYKSLNSQYTITSIPEVHKEYADQERVHFLIEEISCVK